MHAKAIIHGAVTMDATGVTGAVPWWSFTKTVLAVAVMRLWEMRRVDLDGLLGGAPYTLAQLLRHEAGLGDYGGLRRYQADVDAGRSPWPIAEMLEATEAGRLRYAPGEGWAYSNVGYWKVGRLIEAAWGGPLADALAELVFGPAGVTTARLAGVPADLAGVAMGDAAGYHPGWVYHGLAVGSAMDAAQLLHVVFTGGLVGPVALARMLEAKPLPQFRTAHHPDPAYGLGLMMSAAHPRDGPVGHSGSGPGSRIAAYSRRGTTCVVWAAASAGIDPEAEAIGVLR